MKTKVVSVFLLLNFFGEIKVLSQCNVPNTAVYSFTTNGIHYEIIKSPMNWTAAAACAVQRGGKLAEILSKQQNDSIFHYALNKAGINVGNTQAPDGGGASYIWIGGNDLQNEGKWIWDGDGDLSGPQFWQGNYLNGNPVGGYYNNWGSVNGGEPDDFFNQDGLGLALTSWPYGNAGEWNDLSVSNNLYFVIQYSLNTTGVSENTPVSRTKKMAEIYYHGENELIIKLHADDNNIKLLNVYNLEGRKIYSTGNIKKINDKGAVFSATIRGLDDDGRKIYFGEIVGEKDIYFVKFIK